ncbi:hypothetical protein BQ6471_03155 [Vibrio gazogenes]|nr:hypothetical protein BQ6471_03155 [Vibrio gazogenes]
MANNPETIHWLHGQSRQTPGQTDEPPDRQTKSMLNDHCPGRAHAVAEKKTDKPASPSLDDEPKQTDDINALPSLKHLDHRYSDSNEQPHRSNRLTHSQRSNRRFPVDVAIGVDPRPVPAHAVEKYSRETVYHTHRVV